MADINDVRNISIRKDKTLFSTGYTDCWLWVYDRDTGIMLDGIKVGRFHTTDSWQVDSCILDACSHLATILRKCGNDVEVESGIKVNDLRNQGEEALMN